MKRIEKDDIDALADSTYMHRDLRIVGLLRLIGSVLIDIREALVTEPAVEPDDKA